MPSLKTCLLAGIAGLMLGFISQEAHAAPGDTVHTLADVPVADPIWLLAWDGVAHWGYSVASDRLYEFTSQWDVASSRTMPSPFNYRSAAWDGAKFLTTEFSSFGVKSFTKTTDFIDEFALPSVGSGITLNGNGRIFVAESNNFLINGWDPPAGGIPDVVITLPIDTRLNSLEWDGAAFWAHDKAFAPNLIRVSDNGVIILTVPSPAYYAGDMSWDGALLHLSDPAGLAIHSVGTQGQHVATHKVPVARTLNPRGLAWDGATLWAAQKNQYPDVTLNRLTTSGKYVEAIVRIPADSDARGLAWDGSAFWLADANQLLLLKYSPDGTKILSKNINDGNGRPYGVAFNGTNLRVLRGDNPNYKIETRNLDGEFISSMDWTHAGTVRAMAWDGTNLLMPDTTNGQIVKVNPSTGANEGTVPMPFGAGDGIEFDGRFLWLSSESEKNLWQLEWTLGVTEPVLPVDDQTIVQRNSTDNQITVSANDPGGLTVFAVGEPEHGTATMTLDAVPKILYSPEPGYRGTDQFYYGVVNGLGVRGSALVSVTVEGTNNPPTANDDMFEVELGQGPHTLTVLANDTTLPDLGETLTIDTVTSATNGTATIAGGGTAISYQEPPGFTGIATFSYTINDGFGGMDSANVTVTVVDNNADPTATDDNYQFAVETGPFDLNVLANDTTLPDIGETLTIVQVSTPSVGTAAIISNGTLIRYTEQPGYEGFAYFNYTVDDGNGGTDTANVQIEITPQRNYWQLR